MTLYYGPCYQCHTITLSIIFLYFSIWDHKIANLYKEISSTTPPPPSKKGHKYFSTDCFNFLFIIDFVHDRAGLNLYTGNWLDTILCDQSPWTSFIVKYMTELSLEGLVCSLETIYSMNCIMFVTCWSCHTSAAGSLQSFKVCSSIVGIRWLTL